MSSTMFVLIVSSLLNNDLFLRTKLVFQVSQALVTSFCHTLLNPQRRFPEDEPHHVK